MLTVTTVPSCQAALQLHEEFLSLLPIVQRHARVAFRALPAVHREEAVAEAVAAAFESYVRLKARGKDPVRDFPSQMAHFGVLHVKDGRHVGGKSSSKDVMSAKAQQRHRFTVEPLPTTVRQPFEEVYGEIGGQRRIDAFEEIIHEHTRSSPADQAIFRIDFRAFKRRMTRRDRQLAEHLAVGNSAKSAATRFRLSPGRVTQIRQRLAREWHSMHGEEPPTTLKSARQDCPQKIETKLPRAD